jgi:hypothetical protein
MSKSLEISDQSKYVIVCDIADFYSRVGHHQLENALLQLRLSSDIPWRIMEFLKNFSNTKSYGLPIGGPAARLLSELVLNQIDRLLLSNQISFCRFSDDFHIFTNSLEDAYRSLVLLSEKLLQNQGLTLQKAKTRLLTGAGFKATAPLRVRAQPEAPSADGSELDVLAEQRYAILRFSIRFDPYSPTKEADYAHLKFELQNSISSDCFAAN